jgi:succinate dehydrogenase cytochrome b556 subunit
MRQELKSGLSSNSGATATAEERRWASPAARPRPKSPNIQNYRPQLTSVLSILNRITGTILSVCAVLLVIWLVAAATGPLAYGAVQGAIASWLGQAVLFGATFAFFLHLCGGRHPPPGLGHRVRFRAPVDLRLGTGGRGDERGAHRGGLGRQLVRGGIGPWIVTTRARPWAARSGWAPPRTEPDIGGRSVPPRSPSCR